MENLRQIVFYKLFVALFCNLVLFLFVFQFFNKKNK